MRLIDWLLRSRETGRIVVAQAPNVPLGIFLVATVVRWVGHPHGTAGTAIDAVAGGALLWWSADEILRGVNPFRRLLGAVVAVAVVAGIVARA